MAQCREAKSSHVKPTGESASDTKVGLFHWDSWNLDGSAWLTEDTVTVCKLPCYARSPRTVSANCDDGDGMTASSKLQSSFLFTLSAILAEVTLNLGNEHTNSEKNKLVNFRNRQTHPQIKGRAHWTRRSTQHV
jgi:hypothetical protein